MNDHQVRELWCAVIQRAVEDYQYIEGMGENPGKHIRYKAARRFMPSPHKFLRSEDFDEICCWLELDAAAIREHLGVMT